MSIPTHSIHSIHGTFAGLSSYSKFSPHSSTSYSSHAGVVMEASQIDQIPPGLSRAAWRTAPVSIPRTASSSTLSFPVARRAPPPPPSRLITSQSIPFPSEDPFNDSNSCAPVLRRPTPQRTHFPSQSYTVRLPNSKPIDALLRQRTAQRAALERETRCKVVAGILLNRVHAVGKPMRRVPSPEAPRTYRRSRLSTITTADDFYS